ncbi:MAG TPA: acyl carrier protein [Nocardioides sp.]|uniref:acyl carrier protein n=1 Tax=Nocardioides sp. TaxID=35761 RepID=UPI002ED92F31
MISKEEIEQLIVELLADDRGMDTHDLWEELNDLGVTMPVDSLLAVEIVVRLEQQLGIDLPTTADTTKALRSVKTFAEAVWNALPQSEAGTAATA